MMEHKTISEKDVFEYREIYYEYFKPLYYKGICNTREEYEAALTPALEKFGWTKEKYEAFCFIDISQRISKMKSETFLNTGTEPKVEVRCGDFTPNSISLSRLPELKCPRRTTQID